MIALELSCLIILLVFFVSHAIENRPADRDEGYIAPSYMTANHKKAKDKAEPITTIYNKMTLPNIHGDFEVTDPFHLAVTYENIRAALANPNCTYDDCDALFFSCANSREIGACDPITDEILTRQREIVYRDLAEG